MKSYDTFLGIGWSFPPSFDKNIPGAVMSEAEENIRENIRCIISTPLGERIMHPYFGCDLNKFIFEEIDTSLINRISSAVSDALVRCEPRILLNEVITVQDPDMPGLIMIHIEYTVRATNTRNNMVYPFYIKETSLN